MSETWTYPMHREAVRNAPGACPICGMSLERRLERRTNSEPDHKPDDEPDDELRDMALRFAVSAPLTLALFVVAMSDVLPGRLFQALGPMRLRLLVQLALATPVCLWAARPFYERAAASVRHRRPNMFALIGLGSRSRTAIASSRPCCRASSRHRSDNAASWPSTSRRPPSS